MHRLFQRQRLQHQRHLPRPGHQPKPLLPAAEISAGAASKDRQPVRSGTAEAHCKDLSADQRRLHESVSYFTDKTGLYVVQ